MQGEPPMMTEAKAPAARQQQARHSTRERRPVLPYTSDEELSSPAASKKRANSGSPADSHGQQHARQRPAQPPVSPTSAPPVALCPICLKNIVGDHEEHILQCSLTLHTSEEGRQQAVGRIDESKVEEVDDELDVDGVDGRYGDAQFTEADIQATMRDLQGDGVSAKPLAVPENPLQLIRSLQQLLHKRNPSRKVRLAVARLAVAVFNQATEVDAVPRCSVCLEMPREASVSVLCWHVLCTKCWLGTLANKRLCPHCSTITQPGDLRRIYL